VARRRGGTPDRGKWDESGTIPPVLDAHSNPARSASSSSQEDRRVFGSRTTHPVPPLPSHEDDWSDDRLAALPQRLAGAGSGQVVALLDEVPHTPRNVASLIEHLVGEHARRARGEGRARRVVKAPVPHEAVPRVGHILVVRWLTGQEAMGRRVIHRVSHGPASTAAPSGRTSRLLLRHLADQLAAPAPA
jgi:hypothetical protein